MSSLVGILVPLLDQTELGNRLHNIDPVVTLVWPTSACRPLATRCRLEQPVSVPPGGEGIWPLGCGLGDKCVLPQAGSSQALTLRHPVLGKVPLSPEYGKLDDYSSVPSGVVWMVVGYLTPLASLCSV